MKCLKMLEENNAFSNVHSSAVLFNNIVICDIYHRRYEKILQKEFLKIIIKLKNKSKKIIVKISNY
jgi:hypothetical protein